MKHWVFIVLIAGFSQVCRAQCIEDIEKFNAFLGQENSEMLSVLNHSFDTVLQSAYPDVPDFPDRISLFLESYAEINDFERQFYTDSASFRSLKIQLESSGFRKDVYLHEDESYDNKFDLNEFIPEGEEPEPTELGQLDIDLIEAEIQYERRDKEYEVEEYDQEAMYLFNNRPELDFYMNPDGKFWYGLGKYSCSAAIIDILESVKNMNGISLGVVAGGMREIDLNNAFIQQAVMAQFYIPAILRFGYSEKPK